MKTNFFSQIDRIFFPYREEEEKANLIFGKKAVFFFISYKSNQINHLFIIKENK